MCDFADIAEKATVGQQAATSSDHVSSFEHMACDGGMEVVSVGEAAHTYRLWVISV
jgi:hypothetical protein